MWSPCTNNTILIFNSKVGVFSCRLRAKQSLLNAFRHILCIRFSTGCALLYRRRIIVIYEEILFHQISRIINKELLKSLLSQSIDPVAVIMADDSAGEAAVETSRGKFRQIRFRDPCRQHVRYDI